MDPSSDAVTVPARRIRSREGPSAVTTRFAVSKSRNPEMTETTVPLPSNDFLVAWGSKTAQNRGNAAVPQGPAEVTPMELI